ncbi:YagU family protein [Aeromonas veronii]|uniref:YagU family protein n=1 Tax=Aeromonas veronii TaxID=654 RepID=UPI003D24FEE9
MNFFEQTEPLRRRYGLAAFIGLIAGIVSSFVKWGAEHPLPPRSPNDIFDAACAPESLLRAAENIDCSRNFLNPPYVFLRDWLGVSDPNEAVYSFAGHVFNWVGVTHIVFSIVFAVAYCIVTERFPKFKLWQGLFAGLLAQIFVHMITFPLLHLTPPVFSLPWYEHVSEIVGHLVWFWSIEIIRRDLRNRITHEPDPEVSLTSSFR